MKPGSQLRTFLVWLLVPAALFALLTAWIWSLDGPDRAGRFTILQINDVYRIEGIEKGRRGGLARLRTLRRQLEEKGPVLVLHAGDALGPAVLSKQQRSRPMVRCLNLLDGDADAFDPHLIATFGNHEFDESDPDLVVARALESDFPWVTSNVRFRWGRMTAAELLGRRLQNVHETLVVDIGGVRVGILGLVLDDQKRPWLALRYTDPAERNAAVREAIDRLEDQGAEVLVALTHQTMDEDEKLAATFPEIDLVVGGHEHTFHRKKVGQTWITKADADAVSAVAIDVRLCNGEVVAQPEKIDLGQAITRDPLIDAEVKAAFEEYDRIHTKAQEGKAENEREPGREDVVARATHLLEGVEPAVRGRETALGNFLADVARKTMDANIGLVNGGSIRLNDNIAAGDELTGYDLDGIFYYDSKLVRFQLTGAEILRLLQASVREPDSGHGRFLHVSGLKFRYRVDDSTGKTMGTVDKEEVWVGTGGSLAKLLPDATYEVAASDWLWAYGSKDGYELFSQGTGGKSPTPTTPEKLKGKSFRDATRETIGTASPGQPAPQIDTKVEGRIERLDG